MSVIKQQRESYPCPEEFGKYLYLSRKKAGLTFERMCWKVDISESSMYNRVRHPDTLTFRQLDDICKATGMDLDTAIDIIRGKKKVGVIV